jgi:glycerol-3-phosphate dehydrogenase
MPQTTRNEMLSNIAKYHDKKWDVVIIGGGATGLGCAVDAATRGYKTLLLEKFDFAKGTSSKSTKLVHGGVRYLKQGHYKLVSEALRERGYLFKNAPHLVKNLTFDIPVYSIYKKWVYYIGLSLYDFLSGTYSFGASRSLNKKNILQDIPTLKTKHLKGGISYQDGQFDDARLAVELMLTSADHGGTLLNYAEVTGFLKDERGKIKGLRFTDTLNNEVHEIAGKIFINATGVFVDSILQMDEPGKTATVVASQGSHIVVDKKFLPGNQALMIPKTSDGRVLFAIPWHNKCLIGTTDNQVDGIGIEPRPLDTEIEFILKTAAKYLDPAPTKADILSLFAGLRPLAAPSGNKKSTKEISRSHKITVSASNLINIIGGKWTTYRKMAEDTIDIAARTARLIHSDCRTKDLSLHGFAWQRDPYDPLFSYGLDADKIYALQKNDPQLKEKIHPELPYTFSEVEWTISNELAVTLEDVLARRTRAVLLNAKAAIECAPGVAAFMAEKMGRDKKWVNEQVTAFNSFAKGYLIG